MIHKFVLLKQTRNVHGFTLIEVLVAATIVVLLTTIGFVSYRAASVKSRNGRRESDISQVRSALELYRATVGTYPNNTSYNNLMSNAQFVPYIGSVSILDPKNTSPYLYTYTSNGRTYSICYTKEPDPGTQVCQTNP